MALLALFAAGLAAGALNVVAGGGSFLTLPLLIFLGLPAGVANGTNRVAIVVQNLAAVWGFERHRVSSRGWWTVAIVPAVAGAVLGAWAGIEIGDEAFRRVLAFLMVAVTLWTLWDPIGRRRRGGAEGAADPDAGAGVVDGSAGAVREPGANRFAAGPPAAAGRRAAIAAGFFAVGLYAGFVQAGVGFLILAVTTLAGLDLVRGNALKVLVLLVATPLTLAIFALDAKVDWALGAALAAGTLAGALVGVRLTVLKGHRWVQRVVTATVIVFAVKLWFE